MKCKKHDWLFVKEVTDWKSEEAMEEYRKVLKIMEARLDEEMDYISSRKWWQSLSELGMIQRVSSDHMRVGRTFARTRKSGSQYRCATCNEVKNIF